MVPYYKRRSAEISEEEQQRQAKQIEVEEQLRVEEAKLNDLQTRLDEPTRLSKSQPTSRLRSVPD